MRWLAVPVKMIAFAVWFGWQMLFTNARAALAILGIKPLPAPVLMRHRCVCRNEVEVALLSILVSLTPGTLVLATRQHEGAWEIFVHDMYSTEVPEARQGIRDLERRLLRAMRPEGYRPDDEEGAPALDTREGARGFEEDHR